MKSTKKATKTKRHAWTRSSSSTLSWRPLESAAKEADGWNDLDDAFSVDDMAEDDVGEKASLNVKLGSSSSLDQQGLACATSESENETELRQRKGVSSTTGVTTTTSEGETSSLGNSPNVRKTSKKSKKSKKKRF